MAQPLVVVSGATGNIGSELCRLLLAGRARVRALGRDGAKLKRLGAVEGMPGTLEDGAYLTKALQGADAVFAMTPPVIPVATDYPDQIRRLNDVWAKAIGDSRVQHVVALSSIGAELADGNGPIQVLHALEQRFATLPAAVLFLRPGYFLENLYAAVGMIRSMGVHGSVLRGDVPLAMIATRDIAAVAAKRLLARDFSGKSVLELQGAREYTMAEVTRVLGKAIGKPDLPYVQFPESDAKKAMLGMGFSEQVAGMYIEMQVAFNAGRIKHAQQRGPQTTTPTTLEEFARQFAAAYEGARMNAKPAGG